MSHYKDERTLVLIKPDGLQRSLVGEIIKRFEQLGIKLVGVKMLVPTPGHIETHYTLDPNWRKITGEKTIKGYKDKGLTPPSEDPFEVTAKILKGLMKYMTSGPVIAMVWQGAHAVELVRKLTGGTEPLKSDVGTIRGDYAHVSYAYADNKSIAIKNLIHASSDKKDAEYELPLWFSEKEMHSYSTVHDKHIKE